MIKEFYEKLIGSFDNKNPHTFSGRKLTAFAFVVFSGYIHIRFVNTENAIEALLVDAGTALLCLGIITFEQVIKFKNGNDDSSINSREIQSETGLDSK